MVLRINLTTLEAHILRANISHDFSDSRKGNLIIQSSDLIKDTNLYASGYDGTLVTLDGYDDPTENLIVSGNIVSEIEMGATTHTLLLVQKLSIPIIRISAMTHTGQPLAMIKKAFKSQGLDISVNSAGVATAVDFVTKLKSQTESDIKVSHSSKIGLMYQIILNFF